MYVIETRRLAKRYGTIHALGGIDLCVPRGSIFGFLGPNGAGKTTTMRILVGLLRPTAGRADVLGLDAVRRSTEIRRRIGYLPGDVRLYEWMTGRQLLSFCDAARGGGAGNEIHRLRERFDLNLDRRIRDYSRGMKQKLGLIAALAHRPELLVLDEPTTALDPLVQQTLYDELRAAAAEGRTVLFSSHTLSEVELLCDRVAIIRSGLLIEDDTIERLRGRAVRHVTLRLRGGAAAGLRLPDGAATTALHDGEISMSWKGEIGPLIGWLAGLDLADVAIGPPDLEDLFAAYYRNDQDDSPEAPR
ncbi:MAG: ABC transporter [Planctomycetota bacterium]|nr:MAG: ABC transporter [Planctomycetota bacterium]